MEAEDCVSSLSISSSVLENSYGADVIFMRFHETDRLIDFISLAKQILFMMLKIERFPMGF
jgi:hypothetical protein